MNCMNHNKCRRQKENSKTTKQQHKHKHKKKTSDKHKTPSESKEKSCNPEVSKLLKDVHPTVLPSVGVSQNEATETWTLWKYGDSIKHPEATLCNEEGTEQVHRDPHTGRLETRWISLQHYKAFTWFNGPRPPASQERKGRRPPLPAIRLDCEGFEPAAMQSWGLA